MRFWKISGLGGFVSFLVIFNRKTASCVLTDGFACVSPVFIFLFPFLFDRFAIANVDDSVVMQLKDRLLDFHKIMGWTPESSK